jgi:hypothetical protein
MTRFDELYVLYESFRAEIFVQSIFVPVKVGFPKTFRDASISPEQREVLNEMRILLPGEVKKRRNIDRLYLLSYNFRDEKLCDEIFNKMVKVIANSKNLTPKKIKNIQGKSLSLQTYFYRSGLSCAIPRGVMAKK